MRSLDEWTLTLELPVNLKTVEQSKLLHVGLDLVTKLVQDQAKRVNVLTFVNFVVFWLNVVVEQLKNLRRHVGFGACDGREPV